LYVEAFVKEREDMPKDLVYIKVLHINMLWGVYWTWGT